MAIEILYITKWLGLWTGPWIFLVFYLAFQVLFAPNRDSALAGSCRIRSRTQGIALSLGDRITIVQRGVQAWASEV